MLGAGPAAATRDAGATTVVTPGARRRSVRRSNRAAPPCPSSSPPPPWPELSSSPLSSPPWRGPPWSSAWSSSSPRPAEWSSPPRRPRVVSRLVLCATRTGAAGSFACSASSHGPEMSTRGAGAPAPWLGGETAGATGIVRVLGLVARARDVLAGLVSADPVLRGGGPVLGRGRAVLGRSGRVLGGRCTAAARRARRVHGRDHDRGEHAHEHDRQQSCDCLLHFPTPFVDYVGSGCGRPVQPPSRRG